MRKLFRILSGRIALEKAATFLGFSAIIVFLFVYRGDVINTAKNLDPTTTLIILLTIGAQTAIRALRDGLLYSAIGSSVPFFAIYLIQLKQALLNHLPLKPGTVYAAISLREYHGVSLSGYASVFLAQSILTLGLALVIASFAFAQIMGFSQLGGTITIALLGLLAVSLLCIPVPPVKRPDNGFVAFLKTVHEGMATLSGNTRLLMNTIILGSAGIFLRSWRIYVILIATGIDAEFSTAIILSVGIYLSLLLSITPAGIGVREGIVATAAGALSVSPVAAVITISLERVFVIIYCAVLIIIGNTRRKPL